MVNEIALPESYFVILLTLSGMNQVYAVPTRLAFGHCYYQRQHSRRIAANQEGAAKQHIIGAEDAKGVWRTALNTSSLTFGHAAPQGYAGENQSGAAKQHIIMRQKRRRRLAHRPEYQYVGFYALLLFTAIPLKIRMVLRSSI